MLVDLSGITSEFLDLQAGSVVYYSDSDPVLGLIEVVKRELGLAGESNFTEGQHDMRTR